MRTVVKRVACETAKDCSIASNKCNTMFYCYAIGRVKEDPSSWASVLSKDTKKNLKS